MRGGFFLSGVRATGLSLILATGLGAAATAATLTPADVRGGAYSSSYLAPTVVAAGYTSVTGSASAGQMLEFEFSGLPAGAQSLSFTFSLASGIGVQGPSNGWAYANGGGTLLYSIGAPFAWSAWGGTTLGSFGVSNSSTAAMLSTLTLTLDPSFSGPLYLGLAFGYGSAINFSIDAPSNAIAASQPEGAPSGTLAGVPLPAGAPLLAGALGLVALLRRRRA